MNTIRGLSLLFLGTALLFSTPPALLAYEGFLAPLNEIPLTTPLLSGARALGMGGASLAVADDSSALSSNPAALARLQRIEFAGGISKSWRDLEGTAFGDDFSTSLSRTRFSSVRFAYPLPTFRGSLVLGLAGDRVYDFGENFLASYEDTITWEENAGDYQTGPWRQTEDLLADGGMYAWTFGAAMDASPRVSLGASLSYWTGDFSRRFRWTAVDVNGLSEHYDEYVLSVDSNADVSGFRGKAGALFYMASGLTGALVVESPVTLTFDGVEQATDALDGAASDPEVTYFSDEVELPFSFGTGLSYTPTDAVLLAADLTYTDWSEMTYAGLIYLGDQSERRAAYEATTDVRLGVEVTVPSWPLRLRAGYGTSPIAYRGLEIDRDRSYFTLGAGVLVDTVLALDLAWAAGSYERSGIGYDYMEAVNTNTFVLEGTYRF